MESRTIKNRSINYTAVSLDLICGLIVLLFVYTAGSKLLNFNKFQGQMYVQSLPRQFSTLLIWTLPPLEFITSILLIYTRTRLIGLWMSVVLMALFTGYAGLVLFHVFEHVPCACGGAISGIGWTWHFILNLFFLLLTIIGIYLTNRERRVLGKQ